MVEQHVIDDLKALQHLHRHGRGLIHNPSDKHLHHAACDDVERMTVGQKKWFFPTYAEARTYLDGHQARWGGQWTCCENCSPSAARPADPAVYAPILGLRDNAGQSTADAVPSLAGAEGVRSASPGKPALDEVLEVAGPRVGARSVEAWSQIYLPFEPKTLAARELRRELRGQLRRLVATRGEVLHAVFAGERPARADVENLLLYNVDMDGGCFAAASTHGLRFELATRALRAPPSGRQRAYAYQYRTVPRTGGLVHWREVRTLASWHELTLSGPPTLADVWLELRRSATRGRVEYADEPLASSTPFAVRLVATAPTGASLQPAPLVKPTIDGVVCALQAHGDEATIDEVSRRVAARVGATATSADEVAALLCAREGAALGVVPRLLVPRGEGVQWAPGDDLCLAGELLIDHNSSAAWTLSGKVVEIAPR